MTQQYYLTVNGDHLKKPHVIKTFSFTSDDDETGLIIDHSSSNVTNQEKLLTHHNPSIDTNNNEDYSSENTKKIRKRRSRRQTEIEANSKRKISTIETPPWYTKWDLSRVLFILFFLFFVYLFWLKREIWLERFLTSNIRVRHRPTIVTKTELSSVKEDPIENLREKIDIIDDYPRFNSSKKSRRFSSILPKENHTIHYSTYQDILEQVRINFKSRFRDRKVFSKLSKTTGLTRVQLNRFIYKKDFRLITFERFLILLDLFDLMILIVPK